MKINDKISRRILNNMNQNDRFKKFVKIFGCRVLGNNDKEANAIFKKFDKNSEGRFTKDDFMKQVFYNCPQIDT